MNNATVKEQETLHRTLEEQRNRLAVSNTMAEKQRIVREMADTGSAMVTLHEGRLGHVARGISGTLVSPPLEPNDVKEYFGDQKSFPQIEKLMEINCSGRRSGPHARVRNELEPSPRLRQPPKHR